MTIFGGEILLPNSPWNPVDTIQYVQYEMIPDVHNFSKYDEYWETSENISPSISSLYIVIQAKIRQKWYFVIRLIGW
jgi:hypothetical protein